MAEKVTAIIDIGKTNKKFFLFDEKLNELKHQYIAFDEVPDDDGFPSENLQAVEQWMKECVRNVIDDPKYELININFSAYGASLVHLDEEGRLATPFYNYLKPLDETILENFFVKYGEPEDFALETSSPVMGLLNSGLQLYFLKYAKPELFSKIKFTIHLPQYLSNVLTGHLCSDYTSIGCHTALWDFRMKDYHEWVMREGIRNLLSPIFPSDHSFRTRIMGKLVNVGIGVHDSSSALIPYIQSSQEPFVLISTGTWSVCMNYFNEEELTYKELENDCLNFLSTNGTAIKASRLFLGREMNHQTKRLDEHFSRDRSDHQNIRFDPSYEPKKRKGGRFLFNFEFLRPERFGFVNNPHPELSNFSTYEEAYHYLMDELTDLQVASLNLAIGKTKIKNIYLDGGFSNNEVFMQMLANKLPEYTLFSSSFAKGTALGAAILINKLKLSPDFLSKNYDLKVINPLSFSE